MCWRVYVGEVQQGGVRNWEKRGWVSGGGRGGEGEREGAGRVVGGGGVVRVAAITVRSALSAAGRGKSY